MLMLSRSGTFLREEGLSFMIFTNTRNEFEKFGLYNTKNIWLENILAHAHLWRGSTQIEYSSQKMAQQV